MAVMLVGKVDGIDPDTYDRLNQEMGLPENAPDGLISHTAAPADGGMMIVDVWESMENFEDFMQNTLMPAMGRVGLEAPASPQPPDRYEVHNRFSRG